MLEQLSNPSASSVHDRSIYPVAQGRTVVCTNRLYSCLPKTRNNVLHIQYYGQKRTDAEPAVNAAYSNIKQDTSLPSGFKRTASSIASVMVWMVITYTRSGGMEIWKHQYHVCVSNVVSSNQLAGV